jgi:hypothetical protein
MTSEFFPKAAIDHKMAEEIKNRGHKRDTVSIPRSSTYYVRTALQMALSHQRDKLTWLESIRDNENEPVPPMYASMLTSEISYTKQWLREATEEFNTLPSDIKPYELH